MVRIPSNRDRRVTQVGPGKATRGGPPPLTMDQRIASASRASGSTRPGDVRPLMDNDGDNDDD